MFEVSHRPNRIRVSFSATLDNVDRAVEETKIFLATIHAEQYAFDIILVLREGLANAVVDGSNLDPEKSVHFSLTLDEETLAIHIEDTGGGFNWRERLGRVPAPESESGRGLAIMKLYCDSVAFNEKGNILTLKKIVR